MTYIYSVVAVDKAGNESEQSNRQEVTARVISDSQEIREELRSEKTHERDHGEERMLRLYRIDHEGQARYAAEREGKWRLVDGDIFGDFKEGAEIASEGTRLLAPVSRRRSSASV